MKKNLLTIFFIMLIMATFQGVSIASSNVVYITHGDHKDTISYNSISDSKHRYTSACPASGKWITSSSSHNYSSWKTNNDGTHSRKCSDCLYVQTGKHTYGAWKSISDTQHRKDCTVCNGYLKDSHKVTTAATCTTAAYCGTCSSYYGDALGHIEPDSYSVSTTQHWKLCDRGCGAYVKEKENHKDENTDSICDVCGYIMDNIAPTIAFNPITNTMVAKQHSTIVTVTDEGGSGVGECKYVWTTNSTAPTEEASYTTAFTTGSSLKTPVGTGTYYLHVLAKDGGGNTAKNSSQGFVIDNTAPVGTIKINNGASFTTSNNVTLNISSSSSDVYQMAINDEATKPTYEAYATTRAWQFDATEGEKTIYYWFKDAIGNESGMNKVSILLDLSNPTLGTLNVDSVTTNSISVTVVGAKDSVSGIKSYDYYLDGNLVAEGVKSTTYTYTSLTPNTSYALSYLVRDNVDKTAGPSAAVNKYTLAAMPANITAVTKSSGTAIDISWGANGNSAGTTYILEYTIDGNSWTQLASTTNLTYSHTGLAKNQTIQYRVKARNGESIDTNYNGPSVAKTTQEVILNTIILDTVAPLAIFTLNEDSKGIDLSFTVDIEEANKIDELKYKWTTTATKLTTASEFTDGTFNPGDEIQIPEGYEGGNYYLQVYTKDKATNEGIYVSSVFEYHSHIGAVEVLIEQGRLYTNTSEVTLALNAPGATQMYISENQIKISEIAENAWITYAETMEFTLSSEDGTKIVYAYFRDAYGDYGESPANDDILLDTTAPIIGDVIGPQYTNKESGNTVEISASGFDDFGGSADMDYYSVIWQYKIEDGEFVTGSSKSVATSNDTFLLPITEEGLYIVRITLIDRAGNSQDNYKDIEVIVDRTAPEIGSITESSTSNYADGEKILINAKDINDPISGVSKVSGIDYCNWSYTNSSNTTTETAGAIINNNSEYEFTVSSEGTYVATITVYDKAGNRGTATTNITVDRTGPDISAFDMSLSATTTTITATISGATDDMQVAGYKYYIGVTESELVETSLKDSNIYTFEGLAPAKGYYIAYKVVDIYGNESEISEIKKKYTLANAPIDLNATDGIYAKRIDIEWDNNENSDEAIYELEISEDGTQWTAVIYSGNDLAYNHMGLDTNSTKYYRARAKNAEGIYSEYSNIDIGSTIEDAEIPIFYISSVENMTTGLEGGMRGSDTLKIVIIGYDESYKEHSIIEEDITFIVDYDEVTVTQKEIESIIEKEDGIEITLIISGVANEGELLVCIPEGKITDIVGNVNEAENISTGVIVDNTLPEVTANNIDYGEKEYIGLSDMGSGIKYWAITTGTTAPTEYAEIPNIEDVEEELISGDEYIYEEDLVNQVSGDQLNVWYEVSRTVGSLTTTFEGLNVGIYYAWGRDTAGNVDSKIFVVKQPEEENNNLLNAIVTLNPTIYQYDGTAKEPKVTVEFEGNILEENVDYTVTYKDNIEVGTATAVITGIGDYRGEISENFIINPVATEDDEIVLDTVGPTISNIIGTAGESITITADIEDPDISEGIPGSGVNHSATRYLMTLTSTAPSIDSSEWQENNVFEKVYQREVYLWVKAVDNLGNTSMNEEGIVLELSKPVSMLEITVDEITQYVYNGQEHKPEVVVKDGDDVLKSGDDYIVTYKNNINVETDTVKPTVIITGVDYYQGTVEKTFTINKRELIVTPDENQSKVFDTEDPKLTFTYENNVSGEKPGFSGDLARVSGDQVGTYVITQGDLEIADNIPFLENNYKLVFNGKVVTFEIISRDLSDATIVVTPNTFVYDGTAKEPSVAVTVNGKPLVLGTDYTVDYQYNINVGDDTTAEKPTVIITGKGNYSETAKEYFAITPSKVIIPTLIGTYTYNASMQTAILENLDTSTINVSGDTRTDAGTQTISLSLKDKANYQWTDETTADISYEWTINKYNLSNATVADIEAQTYTGSAIKPTPEVTVPIPTGSQTNLTQTDIEYSYTDNTNVGTATVTVTAKDSSTNYTGSVSKNFEIEIDDTVSLVVSLSPLSFVYDGTAHKPTVTVTANGKELVENTDYTVVELPELTNVGTATVKVEGIGNYADKKATADYTVTARPLTVTPKANQSKIYGTVEPKLEFTYTNNVTNETPDFDGNLTAGTDTTTPVGNYAITQNSLVLKDNGTFLANNYSINFTTGITFEVTSKNISELSISLNPATYTYDGTAKTPKAIISFNGEDLVEGTDYTIEYTSNINAGIATATITGRENYEGSKDVTFTIDKKSIAVIWGDRNLIFNGLPQVPQAGNTEVVDGVEEKYVLDGVPGEKIILDVTGEETNVGPAVGETYIATATINSVKGTNTIIDNYVLTDNAVEFIIKLDDSTAFDVTIVDGQGTYNYDGTAHTPEVIVKVGEKELEKDTDYSVTYSNNINAGTIDSKPTIKVTGINNYAGISKEIEFTINPITLTVTPDEGQYKIYGSSDPIFKYSYEGNLDGEEPGFSGVLSRSEGEDIGEYPILRGSLDIVNSGDKFIATNYTMTYNDKDSNGNVINFTITSKDITDESNVNIILDETVFTYTGQEIRPTATILFNSEKLVQDTDYEITYTSNIDAGTATATIKGINNFSGTKELEFTINTKEIYVIWGDTDLIFNGLPQVPQAGNTETVNGTEEKYVLDGVSGEKIILDVTGEESAVGPKSGDSYVASASINRVEGGQGKKENYKLKDTEADFTIELDPSSAFNVELKETLFTYDGTEHTTEIVVKVGETKLVLDQDYTIKYADNTNAGTASVTITGIGNYLGLESIKYFTISKRDLIITPKDGQSKIFGEDDPTLTYTWENNVSGEVPGIEGALTRENGEDVGEYKIELGSLKLINNVTNDGTKDITFLASNYNLVFTLGKIFTITKKSIDDSSTVTANVNGTEFEYTGSEITPGATIIYDNEELIPGTDYEIRYEENIDAGEATVIITGKGNFTGSIELTFEITPKEVTVEWSNTELIFNNAMQLPTAEVDSGVSGETIVLVLTGAKKDVGEDYTASVESATVEGGRGDINNYELKNTSTLFSIIVDPTMDFNVTLDQYEYVYDGTKHTPEATVKVGTVELVEGQDYEVIYENNKDAGTATVTIKGIENYLGIEKVVEYTIKAATLTLTPTTGQNKIYGEEEPKLTYTLTGNVDADAVGEEGAITANTTKTTAVGEYPIVIGTYAIKDNGTFLVKNYNLVFTSDVMFAVTGKDISDTTTVTANVNGTEFEYTGSEITPGATITYNGETLEPGTDYEIRYEENIDAGEATVIITGKGNYSGSIELTFEITPKEVTVEWSNTELIFNNAMQLPTAEVDSGVSGETIVLTLTGAEKNVGPKSGDEYKAVAEIDKVEGGRAKKENYTLLNTETDFRIILDPNTEFDVTLSESEFEYDGTEHTPEETVKVGTIDLVEGQDYEVVYENNKDAGTGTITIVGIGNYEGVEKVIEITINKIDLTLTPKSGQNKVYRENEPELEYTLTGNVSGEEPGKEGAITANTTIDTPVGEYPIVIGTFAIKDNDKFLVKNYNLVFTNDVMFEVTGKDISDTSKVKVTLNPDTFVYDGTAKEPEATIEYNGETITISKTNTNENFEINYSNNVNVGTAIATIKGKGNYTGVINVEFEITPAVLDVVVNGHNAQYDNKYHTVEVVVNNVTDATIKYGTSEGTYDLDEAPTYIDVGSYPIYVEVTKPNYITYTGNAIVQIDKKTVNVVWSNTDLTFNHKSQKPSAEVLSGIDEETINYNILGEQTNVGTYEAELEITGVAGGRGKASNYDISPMKTTFTIKVDLTMEFDVTLEDDTFTYDGEEQTTDITVKVGEFELVEGRDYELIYENNTNANTEDTTPTVTVKGKGNYEGINKVIEFTIERAALIVTPDEGQTKVYGQEDPIFKYTFSGNQNGETPKFVGELSRESGDNVGLYEILQGTLNIEDDGDFKVSNYNLTLKTGVKFEITKADLSDGILTITPDVYEYNATERTPDTEVKLGDKILVRDQDYKVTYKDNIEVGTATVIIEGIGNYEGEITGEFEIEKVDISKATMTLDPNIFDYDGTEKRPNTTVVYKERTLILDVDYTVAYYNNIYAGYDSAYVIATGINSYEGELKGTFTILGKDLVGEIILEKDVYSYDKTEKRPIVTFVSEEGLVLEENVDFIVEYKDNIDAGTATVVVTGIGNYVGEMEKTFTIEKAYVNLMLKDKEVLYSGNEVTIDAVQIENVFDDLTDYITYKYYTDYELTIEMETLPKEIGVYYVEATLSGALNYFDRESNRARLVIYGEPNKPNIIGKVGETILQDNSSTNENVHIYIYGSSVENTSNDVEIGYKYSFDGITWLEYTEAIELTEEGTTTIYAKAYLKEDPTIESEIATYTITIDKTAPVVDDVIVPEKPDSVVIEIEVSGDDIEDVLITEDPTIDPTDPNSPFNPDNYTDPDVEKPSGDDWSKVDEDGKVIDELTQGDGEKVIYIWVKDKAGNVVGPIERKVTLSALKIGNNNDNKTTIMFKVTDKYLHTSNIQTENIALYVNDMLSQGKVTELIKEDIEGGYKYTAVIEDINGNGEMSIGLISGDVFDKAGNNLDISLKVATNEITVDNILPTMDVSTNDNKVYIVANDEHMKAVMVNGEIIGRTSGTYSSELRDGVNIVTVIDEYGNDVTQEIEYESTTITNKSIANEPELLDGMRAVYWENSVEREANDFIASMYNYSKLGTSEDNTTSEWANAKTEDGSYWVWIPRYAYKATYYTDETKSTVTTDKTIYRDLDVIFLKGKTNEYLDEFGAINPLPKEYVIPDAFRNDSANGGWTSELTGFWISKYEMSREDSTDNINWAATTIELGGGNTLTSNAGNVDNYIRVVSKPGVESWKGINVSTAFTNVLNMNLEANSHLIKNSEWEATLVLTESEYGRNGNYIDLDVEAMAGGLLTSTTTGNNTGVYDLVGGAWEYTSTYIEDSSLEQFASNLVNNTKVEYKEIITQSDTENISLTDVESNVFEETMLENAYNTSLVIFRGGYYNIATMDVESIPVGGSADSRVGFRAVLVCE